MKTEHPYVVRIPDVCGGRPIIVGTRLTVQFVIEQLAAGDTPNDIVESFPTVTLAAIHDAISYYYDHQHDIDDDIAGSSPTELSKRLEFTITKDERLNFNA